ncbi:GMC oxidoreductase [Fistulina hepatica ATCC 64428]|uniref:GMC oxidoreductase n=1 Tax=Fistulina hepatica ATCC 64428 TaxID=1128425 RepID=A0A0D7AJJ2_9AGAR|nr:GMC oxidoreductase [Fistulina hepatica ATCC 64428]
MDISYINFTVVGLVLASRLSEDSNHTVLVLEAGQSGDEVADQINTPADTYYSSLVGTEYDWQYSTVAQTNASDRKITWPRGKVLGGSSAINGMYFVHPSSLELNEMSALMSYNYDDAVDLWGWTNFYKNLVAVEAFTAPSESVAKLANISYDSSLHGTDGPIHTTYPADEFGLNGNWTPTLKNVGIEACEDPSAGDNWGSFIATSSINPANWTRSYSRSGYIDSISRSNLDILTNAQATKINWSSNSSSGLVAESVSYASSSTGTVKNVTVNKEVILAGGVIGSPQLLLLSGVGPEDVITGVGLDVEYELPGVGQHLQDHVYAYVEWNTTAETSGALHDAGDNSSTFMSYINSATAYVNLTALFGADEAKSLMSNISSTYDAAAALVPSTNSKVLNGYQHVFNATVSTFMPSEIGQVEILLSVTGDKTVIVQVALQHPLSQGSLTLNSSSAFDYPIIDPQYLAHWADLEILREGIKLARTIGETAPLSDYLDTELSPGSSVSTDDEWVTFLQENTYTEYHPSSTCSMLPEDMGGVVDTQLLVYGTSNVRVADASVYPFELSCHFEAPTYALAEIGSTIIRDIANGVSLPGSSSSTSAAASSSATSTSSSNKATLSVLAGILLL